MRKRHHLYCHASRLLLAGLLLTGCSYETALQRLPLAEQSQFYTYNKIMTPSQKRAYLAKATAAERTAYLREIGLAQRFQALDPIDQDTVLSGAPRPGMSAEALQFLWGEPYYTQGYAKISAHWYYLGSSMNLSARGNQLTNFGNRVDVYLADNKVVGWIDGPPSDNDGSGERRQR